MSIRCSKYVKLVNTYFALGAGMIDQVVKMVILLAFEVTGKFFDHVFTLTIFGFEARSFLICHLIT
jgi:hypothetical protein